jgi:hypothetical protein
MSDDSYQDNGNSGHPKGSSFSKSFYNKTTTSTIHLPKHKLNGEGSEAAKTARYLQAISTALTAYDPRLASAWEGKDITVNALDFTQQVYSEAAEALMNMATAEGLPSGLFLPTVERELSRITVDSSDRAVNAANVLINKKMLGVALKVQSCFSGIALDAVTSLGLHRFGEWRMKLLTDSAGQDPKLVFKLTKVVTEGLIMEDTSRNNGLNYRKMNSKDDIGAVYRLHIPRMYNLVLAVVRAHNAKEEVRKIERKGGKPLHETSIAFNKAGEVLPPKTPAMVRVMNSGTAVPSGDHDNGPRARRGLDAAMSDANGAPAADATGGESDTESEDEGDYDSLRVLQLQLALQTCTSTYRNDITAIRAKELVEGDEDTDGVTAETKSAEEEARKTSYGDQCAEINEADIREHTAHLITLAGKRQEKKEKYKIEKKARKGYIQVALEHLLANMNGQEGAVDAEDWYDQDDIPTTIRYNLWFGYVYLTQQDDPLLEKWSILASEKADVHPLYPHQATDTQRAQYISLMEHHQEVYRARNPDKHKSGGAATVATGANGDTPTHGCAHFKVTGTCKNGDAICCAAGLHDNSKRFESKEIGKAARERWGGGKGKGKGKGKGSTMPPSALP